MSLCKHFYFYSEKDGKSLQAIEQITDLISYAFIKISLTAVDEWILMGQRQEQGNKRLCYNPEK